MFHIRAHTAALAAAAVVALAYAGPASAHSTDGTPERHLLIDATSPSAGSDPDLVLTSLVVLSDQDVWAAGRDNPYPDYLPALEHWDGTSWQRATLHLPSDASSAGINGLAAVSPTDIYAVGFWLDSQFDPEMHPLLEHWNGQQWSLVDIEASDVLTFSAVSVLSPRRVYLIGGRYLKQAAVFVGHGSSFKRVTSSAPAAWVGRVSAASSTDAWSAGLPGSPGYPYRLLEHWDGAHWTDRTPSFVARDDVVTDIDMASSDSVWTCGYVTGSLGGAVKALLYHYDGTTWHNVAAPDHKATYYNTVSFTQPDDGWLAGAGNRIEHYDGTSWTAVRLPIAKGAVLRDVQAVSPTDAWAIGYGTSSTIALHWDGTTWTKIPAPQTAPLHTGAR